MRIGKNGCKGFHRARQFGGFVFYLGCGIAIVVILFFLGTQVDCQDFRVARQQHLLDGSLGGHGSCHAQRTRLQLVWRLEINQNYVLGHADNKVVERDVVVERRERRRGEEKIGLIEMDGELQNE